MPSALESFLSRNSVVPGDTLPLVHSTRSYNLRSILSSANITPQKCNVFLEEELNYFFVGRPSYKYTSSSSSASHWELPCCFIFSADIIPNPDRIFPFDFGAFTNKRFPDYIGIMPRQEFEVKTPGAPERIIGSFFGSAKDYLDLNPKSKDLFDQEFSLSPLDSEISAIYRLASEGASPNFDDRRFAIEIQSSQPVNLNNTKPLAVVLPEQYLDVDPILDTIQNVWGAEPLGYPMFSLSVSAYYALIYREVLDFYKRAGFLK